MLGRPVPLRIDDTDAVAEVEQTLSYNRTFTCPDTVTAWPAVQVRLDHDLVAEFPTTWAALAVDAAEGLQKVRAAHERQPDTGEGWYLVLRERLSSWGGDAGSCAEEVPRRLRLIMVTSLRDSSRTRRSRKIDMSPAARTYR